MAVSSFAKVPWGFRDARPRSRDGGLDETWGKGRCALIAGMSDISRVDGHKSPTIGNMRSPAQTRFSSSLFHGDAEGEDGRPADRKGGPASSRSP